MLPLPKLGGASVRKSLVHGATDHCDLQGERGWRDDDSNDNAPAVLWQFIAFILNVRATSRPESVVRCPKVLYEDYARRSWQERCDSDGKALWTWGRYRFARFGGQL